MTQQKMKRCPYGCILVNANIFKEIDFYDFNMFFNLVQICFLIKRIFCKVCKMTKMISFIVTDFPLYLMVCVEFIGVRGYFLQGGK